jgi:uncharacterized protein YlxW (UPF0749 family)
MRKLIIGSVLLLLVQTISVVGQVQPHSPAEQSRLMQQLLNEVRQLRNEVRQITTTLYRAQSASDRLKTQQEQVNRLDAELNRVRLQISRIRAERPELKEKIGTLQKRWDDGVIPESELLTAKNALEGLDRTEPELLDRELKLTVELNSARAMLFELNRRMDQAEEELQTLTRTNGEAPQQKPS